MSAVIFVRLKSLTRGRKIREYHGVNNAALEQDLADFMRDHGLTVGARVTAAKKAKKAAKK